MKKCSFYLLHSPHKSENCHIQKILCILFLVLGRSYINKADRLTHYPLTFVLNIFSLNGRSNLIFWPLTNISSVIINLFLKCPLKAPFILIAKAALSYWALVFQDFKRGCNSEMLNKVYIFMRNTYINISNDHKGIIHTLSIIFIFLESDNRSLEVCMTFIDVNSKWLCTQLTHFWNAFSVRAMIA